MRRIVMFNWVTADGYFAAADGSLDWVVPDAGQARTAARSISRFDTALFGRRTYQTFEEFWVQALENAHNRTVIDPHDPARRSREHYRIGVALNEMAKIVFSTRLKRVTWKNARLVRDFDPAEIEAMKRQPGKDMIVMGSGSIVSQLTQYGLIDEYQLAVCPVFLGRGRPLLGGGMKSLKLRLVETKALRSGDVLLTYARPAVRAARR